MGNTIKTFGFFFSSYRKETTIVIILLVLAGLAEAIGISAFLPFLQIVLEGEANLEHIPEGPLRDFIVNSGVAINFVSVGLFIAVAIGLKGLILWLGLRKIGLTVAHISADLRKRLMRALLQANLKFFVSHTVGTSLNAIVTETFRSSLAFYFSARFISAIIQFLVYTISALILSWQVFLGAFFVGTLLIVSLWTLIKVAKRAGQNQTNMAKGMLTQMADMLQGMKPLRAMALEQKFMQILLSHSKGLERAQADQLISGQSMKIFYEPLMVMTAIIGLFVAMKFGGLSGSELALMAVIFIRLLGSMNNAQSEYQNLVAQDSALWSLLESIEETESLSDNWPGDKTPPTHIKKIEFKGVDFSYGNKQVISNANIKFPPQEITILIGKSGSGKTSVIDLLCGFYQPDEGSILINDQNLRDIDLKQWRQILGFVPQELFLFNDTIFENIKVGRNEISEEDVWDALEAADAKDFVEALPDQLHSPVGEGGRKLSGGQRQRLAIARAIIHKPQILFLDEATSALDQEAEQRLLTTLQKLARTITIIFVSHNKTVLNYADNVYKINNGKIEETSRDLKRQTT